MKTYVFKCPESKAACDTAFSAWSWRLEQGKKAKFLTLDAIERAQMIDSM